MDAVPKSLDSEIDSCKSAKRKPAEVATTADSGSDGHRKKPRTDAHSGSSPDRLKPKDKADASDDQDDARAADREFLHQMSRFRSDDPFSHAYANQLHTLFPPRRWQLSQDRTTYSTVESSPPDSTGLPPLQVSAATVVLLRKQIQQCTGQPTTLVAHAGQFVRDTETRRFQLVWWSEAPTTAPTSASLADDHHEVGDRPLASLVAPEKAIIGGEEQEHSFSVVFDAATFRSIFGPTAAQENKYYQQLIRKAQRHSKPHTETEIKRKTEAEGTAASSNVAATDTTASETKQAKRTPSQCNDPTSRTAMTLATTQTTTQLSLVNPTDGTPFAPQTVALIHAVCQMIDHVRTGFEPDASALVQLQPDVDAAHLLSDVAQLQADAVITTADFHMVMDAVEQRAFDHRAASACAQDSERQIQQEEKIERTKAQELRKLQRECELKALAPKSIHALRMRSRKLFGPIGCMRTEAKVRGYLLRRVPTVYVRCRLCNALRIVDARPSETTLQRFVCGSAIAIQPSAATQCGQPDEERTADKHAFVWEVPSHKLFLQT